MRKTWWTPVSDTRESAAILENGNIQWLCHLQKNWTDQNSVCPGIIFGRQTARKTISQPTIFSHLYWLSMCILLQVDFQLSARTPTKTKNSGQSSCWTFFSGGRSVVHEDMQRQFNVIGQSSWTFSRPQRHPQRQKKNRGQSSMWILFQVNIQLPTETPINIE